MSSERFVKGESERTRSDPLQQGELLHKSRMAVFPHHTRANECCQLAGYAASRVVPGTLQDHRAFPVTEFSQTSPTSMGLRSGGPFGSGCDIRARVSHRGRSVGNSFPIR
jgi:hypothetical protein